MQRQLIDEKMCLINMDKKVIILIGLLLNLSISCEKEDVLPNNEFTVIVESTADFACGLPLIRFLDKENQVKEKTSLETLTYNAFRLESSLNVTGNRLIIEFSDLGLDDFRVCNTLGINYPGVAIVAARSAD